MSPSPGGIPEITPTDLAARVERGESLVLVDVREAFEREIADLPDWGQLRIPVREVFERLGEIDTEKTVVFYCRSGSRSGWVTRNLVGQGFENVWNLKGGLLAWKEEVDPSIQAY